MLHTSESLVAWCDGEGALLHSQLVKLGELWRDSSRGRLWEWERRQGEKLRKWKTQEEGKNRTKKSQSVQTATQRTSKEKRDFTHTHTYTSVNSVSLILSKSWRTGVWSVCFMTCLCRVPHRYSSKVQAASLGNAFSQSSGSGESHNTQGRERSMCRGFPNQHQYKTQTWTLTVST